MTPKKTNPKKPQPPEHTKWKKGESGNPGGRPKEPPELKVLKHLTRKELVEVGNLIIKGELETLKNMAKDTKVSVLKAMIASVAIKVIAKGDMHALDVLLNRLVGKVKDEVEHSGTLHAPQVIVTMPSNGREAKDDGSGKG